MCSLKTQLASFPSITADAPKMIEGTTDFEKCYNSFLDLKSSISDENNTNTLQSVGLSFLDMTEILLNTIFAVRSGSWEAFEKSFLTRLPMIRLKGKFGTFSNFSI